MVKTQESPYTQRFVISVTSTEVDVLNGSRNHFNALQFEIITLKLSCKYLQNTVNLCLFPQSVQAVVNQ